MKTVLITLASTLILLPSCAQQQSTAPLRYAELASSADLSALRVETWVMNEAPRAVALGPKGLAYVRSLLEGGMLTPLEKFPAGQLLRVRLRGYRYDGQMIDLLIPSKHGGHYLLDVTLEEREKVERLLRNPQ